MGCQYPKSDNIHFYAEAEQYAKSYLKGCQYPKSDNIHFYKYLSSNVEAVKVCQYPKSDNIHFYEEAVTGYEVKVDGVSIP